ncbi:MAG: septation protein A [bacterium]
MKFFFDLLPVILFFAAYEFFDIYVATAVAIASSVIQVSWLKLKHGQVENMHKITLVVLVIFGGLTLVLQDPAFIKWKPTLVNWLFALAFIGSFLLTDKSLMERMMGHAIELPAQIWRNLNHAWALFFIFSGALNLYVAYNFAEDIWVNFKLFGMLGLTLVFIIAQGAYLARYIQPQESK